ncbi:MAG: class II fructose-bisphosphate aldolase [Anaerolineae bacterium]|nr:class II fructose-bisphosphate aldolase [Anaerolineae bacterium]
MPLVSILNELKKAQTGGYAVPCFDTFEMHGTLGIFDAVEANRAPVMIGLYTRMFDQPNPRAFTNYIRALAEEATVPVSIILDHGASFDHCIKALHVGFTDVMYDGSKLPFDENVATTKMVVQAAHAVGAAVEAELGHVGTGSDYSQFGAQGKGFTDPDLVEKFVEQTGVDFLAIAIGTAHGLYDGEVKLALDLLADIRARVDIPLVLHGGSGLSDAQFQAAVKGGIQKINIFTNLAVESGRRMVENAQTEKASFFSMTMQIREAFRDECARLLDVFGTTNKA